MVSRSSESAFKDETVQPGPPRPVLAARGISKAFGPVSVLENVSVEFHAGQVHAIVGENGAGKSTLMKILSGILEPSSGTVAFQGGTVETGNLRRMEGLGVRLIHQELNLAEDLTVLENLFLGQERRRGFFLDEGTMRTMGRDVLAKVGADVALDARVGELRVSEKQMVEIAKAIARRVTVLILDEPTAVLTRREADRLFEIIGAFAKAGVAILYISHRLEEVKRLAHQITVLRDGRVVTTRNAADLSPNEIVRLMVGRNLSDLFPPKVYSTAESNLIEVRHLSVPGHVTDVSFSLKKGEILGFAGLIGAGRTELFEGITGLRDVSSGSVLRAGRPIRISNYASALRQLRAVYLPEDRKGKGLVVSFDAQTNYSLLGLKRFARWFVDRRKERAAFQAAVDQFHIKISDPSMPVSRLSGGNQQKVVLAKILAVEPEVIIFDEPTRGIDVGTKAQIYRWIAGMAAEGKACVVISSELLEIIGLCHRVIVMHSSRAVASLEGEAINEDEIMLYATGVKGPERAVTL
ncbi:MAG TPA: sugar ABC transporter ATP-binding protein [Chthoniobacterales bacterium]